MSPTPPAVAPDPPVPEPTQGGSYIRHADGSLERVAGTADRSLAERMAAKRKALAEAAPQPAPEQ